MESPEIIKQLLTYTGMSARKFAQTIGLKTVQNIYDIQKGKIKKISPSFAKKIITVFPEINQAWLFTGEGNMLNSGYNFPEKNSFPVNENKAYYRSKSPFFSHIPLVSIHNANYYTTGCDNDEYLHRLPTIPVIIDKDFQGEYRCFEVDGDSMDDGTRNAICDKDIVLGREVKRELWKNKLQIDDWDFVIVHKEGVTIKRLSGQDTEKGIIICHPLNSLYNDFELNLDNIYEIYNIIKIVDRSMRR